MLQTHILDAANIWHVFCPNHQMCQPQTVWWHFGISHGATLLPLGYIFRARLFSSTALHDTCSTGIRGPLKKTSSNRQVCETSLSCYLAKLQKQVFGMMYIQFISMRLGTSSRLCLRNELRRLFCMCFNSHYRTILGVVFRYMAVRTFQWSRGWLVFPILQG